MFVSVCYKILNRKIQNFARIRRKWTRRFSRFIQSYFTPAGNKVLLSFNDYGNSRPVDRDQSSRLFQLLLGTVASYCRTQRHVLLETYSKPDISKSIAGWSVDNRLVISFAYRFHYRWKLLAHVQYFKGHCNASRSFERLLRYYITLNFRGLIWRRPLPLSLSPSLPLASFFLYL